MGPKFGYFPNAKKSCLVTKDVYLPKAKAAFENIGIQITSDGCPYLGSPIDSRDYVSKYVMAKVSDWSSQIEVLSEIALHTQLS